MLASLLSMKLLKLSTQLFWKKAVRAGRLYLSRMSKSCGTLLFTFCPLNLCWSMKRSVIIPAVRVPPDISFFEMLDLNIN